MVVSLIAIGLLLTHVLDGSVGRWDASANRWLASHRTDTLNSITSSLTLAINTAPVIGVAVVVVAVLVWRHRLREALLIVFGLILEITVFLSVNTIGGSTPSTIVRLNSTPTTSGFPSGHAAAARLAGGIALIRVWPRTAGGAVRVALAVVMTLGNVLPDLPRDAPPDRCRRGNRVRNRVPVVRGAGGPQLLCRPATRDRDHLARANARATGARRAQGRGMTTVAVIAHRRKKLGRGLGQLRKVLAAQGFDAPLWFEVNKSRKAPKRARQALEQGADLVLVWGGDGMVQRCIDVLAGTGATVGILPAGTANLFATNLGIPQDLESAVQIALHGTPRPLDVGVINGERFGVMAGTGLDAEMIKGADRGEGPDGQEAARVDRSQGRRISAGPDASTAASGSTARPAASCSPT